MNITTNKPGRRKRLRFDLEYIDDVIEATSKHVWTWTRLPGAPASAALVIPTSVQSYVREHAAALAKLIGGRDDVVGHLRIVHVPTEPEQWAEDQYAQNPNRRSGFDAMVEHQKAHQNEVGHLTQRFYLGIRVGPTRRENLWTTGPFALLRKGSKAVEAATGVDGQIMSADDIKSHHARASAIRDSLRTSIRAEPVGRRELADLVLNTTSPQMRPPRVQLPSRTFGPGLQEILFADPVDPHNRMIDLLDIDDEPFAHVAYATVAATPDEWDVGFDAPWLHTGSKVPFPVDWSIRFRVRSSRATAKDLRKRTAHAADMHQHIKEAGKTPPVDLEESMAMLQALEHEVGKSGSPGMYVQYSARIVAPDAETLAGRVQALKESFHDLGVELQWSSGDQLSWMLSELPGGQDKHRPYELHTNLAHLWAGCPTWSHRVGDNIDTRGQGRIGLSIGQTAVSGTPEMVPFTPHVAMERNLPPGVLVDGSGGSGKSYLLMYLILERALCGDTIIAVDPKGDIVDRNNRRFRLPQLIEVLTGIPPRIIDLRDSPDGALEPFRLAADPGVALQLVLEVLEGFLGQLSDIASAALATAVNQESHSSDPTLTGVASRLQAAGQAGDAAAEALYQRLDMYRRMDFSRLLFGVPGQPVTQKMGENGTVTFLVTHGLELPAANTDTRDMDLAQRLSTVILTLLCRRTATSLLTGDPDYPKMLVIDESHVLMGAKAGRRTIYQCIKMLRSKNGSVVVGSQEIGDNLVSESGDEAIRNNLSTVFAGRCGSDSEAGRVINLLNPDLNSEDPSIRKEISGQQTGEFFMRDADGRVEQIVTDYYLRTLQYAFETNPEKRAKITLDMVQKALRDEFGLTWEPPAKPVSRPAAPAADENADENLAAGMANDADVVDEGDAAVDEDLAAAIDLADAVPEPIPAASAQDERPAPVRRVSTARKARTGLRRPRVAGHPTQVSR